MLIPILCCFGAGAVGVIVTLLIHDSKMYEQHNRLHLERADALMKTRDEDHRNLCRELREQDRRIRCEAVKAGAGRWVADKSGDAKFEWTGKGASDGK